MALNLKDPFDSVLGDIDKAEKKAQGPANRIKAELNFARMLAENTPEKTDEWMGLINVAAEVIRDGIQLDGTAGFSAAVGEAERILEPIREAAKEFTVHYCSHAHIDMNWQWDWPETISTCHDTFLTMDKLMDEFPEFLFQQSQTSIYKAMEDYCPEIFDMISRRMKEGRWASTASLWVESDKNLSSGESTCRQVLYTKRYFKEKFGQPYDAVKLAWECDTFGHAYTTPSILKKAGVTRYYHCRTGPDYWLYWWQGLDGSRILTFHDRGGYCGSIDANRMHLLFDYWKKTGLKDYMYIYGVGDHGGGPTKDDMRRFREMKEWPIWPKIELSTTERFFSIVEPQAKDLKVWDGELNFIFEGCYTSESHIKRANRVSENILPEAEGIAVVAGAAVGSPYPASEFRRGWQMAMFNQFHDILPGSGVRATSDHALGQLQEIKAIANTVKTRALRRLASHINTSAAAGVEPPAGSAGEALGDGHGAGQGAHRLMLPGVGTLPLSISARSGGALDVEPFVIYNPSGFPRTETAYVNVWNRAVHDGKVAVWDETGKPVMAQVIGRGESAGHDFTTLAFRAENIPPVGYKVYTVGLTSKPLERPEGVTTSDPKLLYGIPIGTEFTMENEFFRVEVDSAAGAIKHLIDKETGYDYVPEGEHLGILEYCLEAPHRLTAWVIGQIQRVTRLTEDWKAQIVQTGPQRGAIRCTTKLNNSTIAVEIGLSAGSRMIDFTVITDWIEWSTPETPVPMLRIAFPMGLNDGKLVHEIPFGSIERQPDGHEVPALKWADLSGTSTKDGATRGVTMVNADKYGHSADGGTLRLTLIRSSCDPDTLPEIGHHEIKFAIIPHEGPVSIPEAARAGDAFNLPFSVVGTDVHKGNLPPAKSFFEILTPDVMLAALKRAEDSNAIIFRLYNTAGSDTVAKVRLTDLVKHEAVPVETDILEQPLAKSTAKLDGDILSVVIPPHGIVTVKVG